MDTFDAMHRCIGPHTLAVAKRLRVSPSLVYKWQEPRIDYGESGAYNPLDKLQDTIEVAIECDQGDAAYAPAYYLNQRFGIVGVRFDLAGATKGGMAADLARTIKEFADLAQEAGAALGDGTISPSEARRIDAEGWEAVRAITGFLHRVEQHMRDKAAAETKGRGSAP